MAEENAVVNTEEATTPEATETQVTPEETPEVKPEAPPVEKEQVIPKSRFDEVNDERNALREQNRLLIEMQRNAQNQRPAQPEAEPDYLDPAVKTLADKNKQLAMALGGIYKETLETKDELDLIKTQTHPDIPVKDYRKYSSQIEQIRQNAENQGGKKPPRADVYFYLKGQEALRGGGYRQPEKPAETEPEKPSAIPQTKTAGKVSGQPKKPETLDEAVARLSKYEF